MPPPSAASDIDIGKEIVLPLLQPIVASVSLIESSALAESLVAKLVSFHFQYVLSVVDV